MNGAMLLIETTLGDELSMKWMNKVKELNAILNPKGVYGLQTIGLSGWGGLRIRTQSPRFETRFTDYSFGLFGMFRSFPLVKQL